MFLISLFIFDGVSNVFTKLTGQAFDIEMLCKTENEPEKKETSERAEPHQKELYTTDNFLGTLVPTDFLMSEKNTTPATVVFKEDIHISIPTPPPEV